MILSEDLKDKGNKNQQHMVYINKCNSINKEAVAYKYNLKQLEGNGGTLNKIMNGRRGGIKNQDRVPFF